MTVAAVGKRPLLLRYLRIKNTESEPASCEADVGPVDRWVEKERFCPLEVPLVPVLLFASTWPTRAELAISAQGEVLLTVPLGFSGGPL